MIFTPSSISLRDDGASTSPLALGLHQYASVAAAVAVSAFLAAALWLRHTWLLLVALLAALTLVQAHSPAPWVKGASAAIAGCVALLVAPWP